MKLSQQQLTELKEKFDFMRSMLTERSGLGLVWGANRNTSAGSVTLSMDELDALLSDVQTLWKVLAKLMKFDHMTRYDPKLNAWVCNFCGWLARSEHAEDCPWMTAKKALEVSK